MKVSLVETTRRRSAIEAVDRRLIAHHS